MAQVTIISRAGEPEAEQRIEKLTRFMGLDLQRRSLSEEFASLSGPTRGDGRAVVMHCNSFAELPPNRGSFAIRRRVLARYKFAFVYGFSARKDGEIASSLTGGAISNLSEVPAGNIQYQFTDNPISRQLAGLSFRSIADDSLPVFESSTAEPAWLLSANGSPFFGLAQIGNCQVFLQTGQTFADTESNVAGDDPLVPQIPALIPLLIFLKAAFADECWTNPYSHATLTIDDPLLKPRYGFLTHEDLLSHLRKYDLASTVAFIPWNYRRTDVDVANLYKANAERLSICVHGCDHTGNEFGSNDETMLQARAGKALQRVREHQRITGLCAEPIMIFPQGAFSKSALPALAEQGFIAAVNTTAMPVDYIQGDLKLADFLEPAVQAGGFPLFVRHYPASLMPFAVDLFLGKPALITTHHNDFRTNRPGACTFASELRNLDRQIEWAPLQRSLVTTALYQHIAPARANVKFYTDLFLLRNPYHEQTLFRLCRRVGFKHQVIDLEIDGRSIRYDLNDGFITAEVSLSYGQTAEIRILRSPEPPPTRIFSSYGPKVVARRLLSEFRDNCLSGNERLLGLSRRVARAFSH